MALIEEDAAVELCAQVMRMAGRLKDSRSRFLQSFTPNVAKVHARIVNDFFCDGDFRDKRVLDVGPGLYPFSIIARELGAEVVAIEFDEALADAGRSLGFEVHTDNLDWLPEGKFTGFDGLFLKGPFNACRQRLDTIDEATRRLDATLKPDGWGWIANSIHPQYFPKERRRLDFVRPWKLPQAYEGGANPFVYFFGSDVSEIGVYVIMSMTAAKARQEQLTDRQRQAFVDLGWTAEWPIPEELRDYALNYKTRPWLFTRRLRPLAEVRTERWRRVG